MVYIDLLIDPININKITVAVWYSYTPRSTNIAMDHLKMYFLLNMGIFQPAMLVYQRVDSESTCT